jgi:hypothetical protein
MADNKENNSPNNKSQTIYKKNRDEIIRFIKIKDHENEQKKRGHTRKK